MDQSLLSSRAIEKAYFARREQNLLTGWHGQVANRFTSDQSSETYAFLGFAPALREWIGGRQAKGMLGNSYTIANKHYEGTMEVSVKDVRRDKTGQIRARLEEFADQSEIHWQTLLTSLIEGGESTTCYDGQYFFDTDHSEGSSGSQSNDLTYAAATGTTPTKEEMQLAILQSISAIIGFKDDQGRPMNPGARSFTVMVPPTYYMIGLAAVSESLNIALSANMNPNAIGGGFNINVEMNPDLTWTTKFATFRTDSPIKALIMQEESPLEFKSKAEGSEFEFDNDAWQFGVDGWRNVGYGYWQRACLTTIT
jgi:phage major head subunit gpT-like protein